MRKENARLIAGLEAMAAITSGSTRPNIGMPNVVPELSEMLKTDGTITAHRTRKPARSDAPQCHCRGPAVSDPALSGSALSDPALSDLGLARLVDAWPKLPQGIRAGILAMIEATQAVEATEPRNVAGVIAEVIAPSRCHEGACS